jgi:FAD/FMN-containing dehydrogenase
LRLCALLDGETPLGICRRLLVGSEGTLAFIAEAVLETIPVPRVTSVAWIPVPTIDEAIALVSDLVGLGASAVELMVAPALTVAGQAFAETPYKLREKHLRPLLKSLDMKAVGFHAIRHGVASELTNSGTPITAVRDQMRHSDVRVTLGIYGHVIGNTQRKAVEGLSRFIGA